MTNHKEFIRITIEHEFEGRDASKVSLEYDADDFHKALGTLTGDALAAIFSMYGQLGAPEETIEELFASLCDHNICNWLEPLRSRLHAWWKSDTNQDFDVWMRECVKQPTDENPNGCEQR